MDKFELTITAEIRQLNGGYGGLRVNEQRGLMRKALWS